MLAYTGLCAALIRVVTFWTGAVHQAGHTGTAGVPVDAERPQFCLLYTSPAADDEVGIYGKVLPEDSITDMCKKLYATNVAAIGQTMAQIDEENVGLSLIHI